jgi:hypothetical protein
MAQAPVQRRDERMQALVEVVSELALMDEPRKPIAGTISGLDIHYHLGAGHPLLGRRMPDLDPVTADGPLRVFELLHDAGPLPYATQSSWPDELRSRDREPSYLPSGGLPGFACARGAP